MSESAAKKDLQKLQRAIVDGLEDVKAQDVRVFNTEHLSPLFERVIVASGTSNRQTKALASSVRDKVREAGFNKPRVEGEDNGEWIIVDCGAAVAHIMQPAIRHYYNLEEIWGEKPVRLKSATARTTSRRASGTSGTARKTAPVAGSEPAVTKPTAAAGTAVKKAAANAAAKKLAPRPPPTRQADGRRKAVAAAVPRKGGARAPAVQTVVVGKSPARGAVGKAASASAKSATRKAAPRSGR